MEQIKERIVSNEQIEFYLNKIKNPRHKLFIMIPRDSGARVSELIKIKWSDFDFKNKTITLGNLKKGDEKGKRKPTGKKFRKVPLTNRTFKILAELSEKVKPKNTDYVFYSNSKRSKTGHIVRQTVNQTLTNLYKKYPELEKFAPHDLRHTAITALRSQGSSQTELQDFAGHNDINTTAIYLHNDQTEILEKIEASSRKKETFFEKIQNQFLRKETTPVIQLSTYDNRYLVGRENEVKTINSLLAKEISIILIGERGSGKTQILENLRFNKKIFKIDDTKLLKKSVLSTILELFEGDKEAAKNLIYKDKETSQISKLISKDSLTNLCKTLCEIVDKDEYILQIGEVDTVTPVTVRALEILKKKFQIITTAREVKLQNASFLSDFQKIEIKNLGRVESIRLIRKLSAGFKIKNWEHYQNHIFNCSQGNPRIIYELTERARKESYIDEHFTEEISNNYLGKTIKEIDVAFPLIAVVSFLLIFWIYTHSESATSMRVLRVVGAIMIFSSRSILRMLRKNTI